MKWQRFNYSHKNPPQSSETFGRLNTGKNVEFSVKKMLSLGSGCGESFSIPVDL